MSGTEEVVPKATCGRCLATEGIPKVNGIQPDMADGWSVLTIAEQGRVVVNYLLCGSCTSEVRAAI